MSDVPAEFVLRDRGAGITTTRQQQNATPTLGDPIVLKERRSTPPTGLPYTQSNDMATPGNGIDMQQGLSQSPNEGEDDEIVIDEDDKLSKSQKTFGRTPNGTVFVVPETHDMVSSLLSPREPKNASDFAILALLGFFIGLLFFLPRDTLKTVYVLIFGFWRLGYNLGIGMLLDQQSKYSLLVYWAEKYKIFDKQASPRIYRLLERELSAKIQSSDYKFAEAPIEYNTWLLFRRLVDLILMCDFVTYVLYAVVSAEIPDHPTWMHACRWLAGSLLFLFNVWVKLDAHRVVKDFAWYWGDFFFLIDQSLIFDGVYDIAPHPMYSVGYAGYYGICLWSASYHVFYVSLLAHASQFIFLQNVEEPHIQKIYTAPPEKRKKEQRSPSNSSSNGEPESPTSQKNRAALANALAQQQMSQKELSGRPLVGIRNFDLLRSQNLITVVITAHVLALVAVSPDTQIWKNIFVFHAIGWRFFYNFGLGAILTRQSKYKMWTRRYLKFGESVEVGWKSWQQLYFVVNYMCNLSFMAACWKLWDMPEVWTNWESLKCTLGGLLILLQIYTANSVYEGLGEFGWFYGDFFFDHHPNLTYSGIYRYLNNPERMFGCASVWGAALMTGSTQVLSMALFAHIASFYTVQMVERPHMQKLYGDQLRDEAGIVRSIKKAIPSPVNHTARRVGNLFSSTSSALEDILLQAKRHLSWENLEGNLDETQKVLLKEYNKRLTITQLNRGLDNFSINSYSISILNAKVSTKNIYDDMGTSKPLVIPYGQDIRISWTAPLGHSKKDWIGMYQVSDNSSRHITSIPSIGRWVAVSKGEYYPQHESSTVVFDKLTKGHDNNDGHLVGEAVFTGERLFWKRGAYEFRYHFGGNHNVMAISLPFEVIVDKFDDERLEDDEDVEEALLPIVRSCLDNEDGIAPDTYDDEFGTLSDSMYARRIVYAVKEMFGLELAPEVVRADQTVRRLSWRIRKAKLVLVRLAHPSLVE